MNIEKAMAEAGAVSLALQHRYERLRIAMGNPPAEDTVGKALTTGDELLLSLQADDSWANFLLVHGELVKLLMDEYRRATSEELQDELAGFIAEFYSVKRLIVPFVTGDDVAALAPESGPIQ